MHITSGAVPPLAGITPAQLQQTVDTTLSQDGISIRTLDPKLTNTGASATADAGGLVISIAHQFDVPFIPGEPTIPIPELGNVGLPAGVYTATTSITFGLAQAKATASGLTTNTGVGPAAVPSTGNSGDRRPLDARHRRQHREHGRRHVRRRQLPEPGADRVWER